VISLSYGHQAAAKSRMQEDGYKIRVISKTDISFLGGMTLPGVYPCQIFWNCIIFVFMCLVVRTVDVDIKVNMSSGMKNTQATFLDIYKCSLCNAFVTRQTPKCTLDTNTRTSSAPSVLIISAYM
jgi:fucose 4-O-acetylase-like acetyltransferase